MIVAGTFQYISLMIPESKGGDLHVGLRPPQDDKNVIALRMTRTEGETYVDFFSIYLGEKKKY